MLVILVLFLDRLFVIVILVLFWDRLCVAVNLLCYINSITTWCSMN